MQSLALYYKQPLRHVLMGAAAVNLMVPPASLMVHTVLAAPNTDTVGKRHNTALLSTDVNQAVPLT